MSKKTPLNPLNCIIFNAIASPSDKRRSSLVDWDQNFVQINFFFSLPHPSSYANPVPDHTKTEPTGSFPSTIRRYSWQSNILHRIIDFIELASRLHRRIALCVRVHTRLHIEREVWVNRINARTLGEVTHYTRIIVTHSRYRIFIIKKIALLYFEEVYM